MPLQFKYEADKVAKEREELQAIQGDLLDAITDFFKAQKGINLPPSVTAYLEKHQAIKDKFRNNG